MTAPTPDPRYWRRASGPLHIIPSDGLGLTLCGTRILQYLSTREVKQRPPDDAEGWCKACLRHEAAGTRRARR